MKREYDVCVTEIEELFLLQWSNIAFLQHLISMSLIKVWKYALHSGFKTTVDDIF